MPLESEVIERTDWLVRNADSVSIEVLIGHRSRGDAASDWMREDDREFRHDLRLALDALPALLEAARSSNTQTERIGRLEEALRDCEGMATKAIERKDRKLMILDYRQVLDFLRKRTRAALSQEA